MKLDLEGQIVCVTGGSEGIGLACAQSFFLEGAHVIICGRRLEKLQTAIALIGNSATSSKHRGSIEYVQADVTVLGEIETLIAHIQARHGKLDILVNNAGTGIYKPFSEVTDAELQDGMAINFFAQFRVSQRALPLLKQSNFPSIINISGRTALRGNFPPGSSCTGPAKAAEIRFSIDLASELAEFGIRVNCVVPGVVKSEERFRLWESQAKGGQWEQTPALSTRGTLEIAAMPPGQKWGVPQDIANVVVFLASPRAAYVNGAALSVDGGPHTKSYVSQLYDKGNQAL